MPDPVWPIPPDKVPTTFATYDAFGTTLLHNSRPDGGGRFFATQWFMIILPVAPMARYWVRQGATYQSGPGTETTEYEISARSRLRAIEIVRTYLYFWLIVPASFLGPITYGVYWSPSRTNNTETMYMFGCMLVSVALLLLVLGLLLLYRMYWRPVREARWVTPHDSNRQ